MSSKKEGRDLAASRSVSPRKVSVRVRRSAAQAEETTAPHRFGRELVPDVATYRTDLRAVRPEGPWAGEADKHAWWDRATGLACIIRREDRGHLGGYVAVPHGHALHGLELQALPPGLDVEVHGGLSYARPCDRGDPEETSICHVPTEPLDPVTGSRLRGGHDDLWWFGFACDKPYDHVPNPSQHARVAATGQVYRDEAYVYRQVVQLAAQLDAIGRGLPKPALADPPPPIATPVIGMGMRR